MEDNINILCYKCKRCNKTIYYLSNEDYDTKCKTCKNEMTFLYEHKYNPSNGLKAIKNNSKQKNNTEFIKPAPIIECPYCHSTDTKKITNTSKTLHTALFGVFSIGRNSKNFHCNQCGSNF